MYLRLILLCSLKLTTSAFLFPLKKWDGLKVTWGVNILNPDVFAALPRTETDAVAKGFVKIADCDERSPFRGRRYVKNNDYAVVLLFDINGYIAGIQDGVPKGLPNGYPYSELQPPFIADKDYYFVTAYFVRPSIICTTGRTADQFEAQGTGTNLYIQNGTDPVADSLLMPKNESGIVNTKWTKGKCFPSMGLHYWYNVRKDMSCHDFLPAFLLYNSGKLTAFGWAHGADLNSTRYEHPPIQAVGMFMEVVPDCLSQQGRLSTMHIYLTAHPELDVC